LVSEKEFAMLIRTPSTVPSRHRQRDHAARGLSGPAQLLKAMALGAAGSALAGRLGARCAGRHERRTRSSVAGAVTMEKATTLKDATGYNNFYEFGTDKDDPRPPGRHAPDRPWTVEIEGLVNKPGRIALDDLRKLSPLEERIYRLRCVEAGRW
jgi:sulfoxide reductase catalytic subunit YedY